MRISEKIITILILFIFSIISSCANTKELKRDTLIFLGAATGMAITGVALSNSDSDSSISSSTSDGGGGAAGSGGLFILMLGGMIGGLFGYGIDLALKPKGKIEEPSNVETENTTGN